MKMTNFWGFFHIEILSVFSSGFLRIFFLWGNRLRERHAHINRYVNDLLRKKSPFVLKVKRVLFSKTQLEQTNYLVTIHFGLSLNPLILT